MKMFEERILRDGKCLPGGVLKVDGFINHQMDPALMMSLARELARRFGGEPLDRVPPDRCRTVAKIFFAGVRGCRQYGVLSSWSSHNSNARIASSGSMRSDGSERADGASANSSYMNESSKPISAASFLSLA